jgi:hypothetical protein
MTRSRRSSRAQSALCARAFVRSCECEMQWRRVLLCWPLPLR